MLVFKEIKDHYIAKEFLASEGMDYLEFDNSIIYGGYEDEHLFGVCIIHMMNKRGELKHLIIKNNYRGSNLGDGLLRASLNKLDKMGIPFVSYPNLDNYLIKFGFKESLEDYIFIKLPEFFNKTCNYCGRK